MVEGSSSNDVSHHLLFQVPMEFFTFAERHRMRNTLLLMDRQWWVTPGAAPQRCLPCPLPRTSL